MPRQTAPSPVSSPIIYICLRNPEADSSKGHNASIQLHGLPSARFSDTALKKNLRCKQVYGLKNCKGFMG
jgi:hypothetical protein